MGTTIPHNEAAFSRQQLLEITSGQLICDGHASSVRGVSTDTRTVQPGELFVALRGERFDGHDHIETAYRAGATAALVQSDVDAPDTMTVIRVADTLQALGALARAHARTWKAAARKSGKPGKLLAVTGSAGKTTTCRASYAVLSNCGKDRWKVHMPVGNLNNAIGVPMVLLGLTQEHGMGIIEVGTSSPGEIAYSAGLVEPDAALVTLVAAAHTEELGDIEAVGREKTTIYQTLDNAGVLIINVDDIRVDQGANKHRGNRSVVRYGKALGVDVRLLSGESTTVQEQRVMLEIDQEPISVKIPILGGAGQYAAAASIAAGKALCDASFDARKAAQALQRMKPEQGRLRPRPGLHGSLLLDDTYNANPASMEDSIKASAQFAKQAGRDLGLVLGDMLELGSQGQAAHEALGRLTAAVGASWLVTVGPLAMAAAETAQASGVESFPVSTAREAGALVREKLNESTIVLFKGSRGMHLEHAVEAASQQTGDRPA